MVDLVFCSHYPFSKAAKQFVKKSGIGISSELIEKAENRVKDAILKGRIKKVADLDSARKDELASYACARMVVSCADNRYLINRYAVAEAKRAGEYLSSDNAINPGYIDEVASEFSLEFEKQGKNYLVALAKYLEYTPRSMDYKLTNREVSKGKVKVTKHERTRMLEEAVKKSIEKSLPIRAEFPKEIKAAGKRALMLLPKLELATLKVGQENYPPCIKRLIEDLAMNVNVPHTARVALAIYLVNAGAPPERIVDYFRAAPDFSEKTTRYQVEHITKKKYRMASCSTMDSYGICVAECRCNTPLRFRDSVHGARLRRLEAGKKH